MYRTTLPLSTVSPPTGGLTDPFGRRITYLRLSVIEQCNYRCDYCMPESPHRSCGQEERLTIDETVAIVEAFASLGVARYRLTGGEPLLRRDLESLASALSAVDGVSDLSLSTNGDLLAGRADRLHRAGINRINLSLDSLDPASFRRITRGGDLNRVVAGIDAAIAAGMRPLKLNMVVMAGINDHEIAPMIEFARQRGAALRFIETMPIGATATAAMSRHLPAETILAHVRQHLGQELVPIFESLGGGPARHYRVADGDFTVGVISAVSRHFCASCNRVRLSARGDLHLCLGQQERMALGQLLRNGADCEELTAAIHKAIALKPWGHTFNQGAAAIEMSQIGG
jgi:cyclic pyranopterin phosphate synthase